MKYANGTIQFVIIFCASQGITYFLVYFLMLMLLLLLLLLSSLRIIDFAEFKKRFIVALVCELIIKIKMIDYTVRANRKPIPCNFSSLKYWLTSFSNVINEHGFLASFNQKSSK
jgi:hypothetical protein